MTLEIYSFLNRFVEGAIEEDKVEGDITTQLLSQFLQEKGKEANFERPFEIKAKSNGVFSGKLWLEEFARVLKLDLEGTLPEGQRFSPGHVVAKGKGRWDLVLSTERIVLNELQMLCGVASHTAQVVDTVRRTAFARGILEKDIPAVFHTRKIIPWQRKFFIDAVVAGGGQVHRRDLSDRVMLKENHKYLSYFCGLSDFAELVRYVVSKQADSIIEAETDEEAVQACQAGARYLLLDNYKPEAIRTALRKLEKYNPVVEVSGGISIENVSAFVLPGVNRLSMGSLTHQLRACDLSLDWSDQK